MSSGERRDHKSVISSREVRRWNSESDAQRTFEKSLPAPVKVTDFLQQEGSTQATEQALHISARRTFKRQTKYIGILGRGLGRELHMQAVGTLLERQFGVATYQGGGLD